MKVFYRKLTPSKLLWCHPKRTISIDVKMTNDPYFILGVER